MSLKDLQGIFEQNNKIRFKLYSLEYIIEKDGENVVAYAIDYSERKNRFPSFKDAMNNFKVYNESIISQINLIEIIPSETSESTN